MRVIALIRAEFARLTATTMSRVALAALMLVPVLYGGLYLWANQDPYDSLDRVPVALVVADTGATVDGADKNYGNDIADKLTDDSNFEWHRVSAKAAADGIANATYDFGVTFPADFSTAITSPETDAPRRATVTLTTNDANSYLASTIGNQAVRSIKEAIAAEVSSAAAERFLVGLSAIRSSLVTATAGAGELADGAGQAASGSATLAEGADQVSDGAARVADGAEQLSTGAGKLAAGAAQVATGARQLAEGSGRLAGAAHEAESSAAGANQALPAAREDILATLRESGAAESDIARVSAELDSLGGSIAATHARVHAVAGQLDQFAGSSDRVADGAAEAGAAAARLADGTSGLASGARQASSGAAALATGAHTASDGVGDLSAGASRLHDSLESGVGRIPEIDPATQDRQAKTIADPVHVKNAALTTAGTYGAGLAPFFASLAAWIGIYALFLIIKPFSRRAVTALHSPIRITLAGWLTPALLGTLQMAALFAVITGGLHFEVHDPLATFAMMGLASFAFAAIILALNIWLGSVGQFLGLVLMVVQLVAAGGTFPWQTLPAPLAWLHQVVPMSYAVDGIRQLMYGGQAGTAWADAGVLLLWLGIALVVSVAGVTRMTRSRTLRDLRPSLIG